jgi:hypothetical protein
LRAPANSLRVQLSARNAHGVSHRFQRPRPFFGKLAGDISFFFAGDSNGLFEDFDLNRLLAEDALELANARLSLT